MSRALLIWKLKLCLAAAAVLLASAITPQQRPDQGQQAKEKSSTSNLQMAADKHGPKVPAPAQARQPQKPEAGDRISAML